MCAYFREVRRAQVESFEGGHILRAERSELIEQSGREIWRGILFPERNGRRDRYGWLRRVRGCVWHGASNRCAHRSRGVPRYRKRSGYHSLRLQPPIGWAERGGTYSTLTECAIAGDGFR